MSLPIANCQLPVSQKAVAAAFLLNRQSAIGNQQSPIWLGLALCLCLVSCDEAARGPRRIRLSLILGESSEWFQGATKWKELVEARTGGRYTIEVVPNAASSGANQAAELQMVRQGQLEASLESTILLSTLDPRWAVFCFPWLFPDHATANAVCDGAAGDEMLTLLMERNLVGLAYGANGFRQITNSVRPIRTLADLQGLKIRIPQGLPPELFTRFGATTRQMNFSDLVLALERRDLHGQENPLSLIAAAKLNAVQEHLTVWNYVYDPIVLCVNRDLWYSLPGEDQRILRACAQEAMAFERQLVAQADQALPARLAAERMAVTRLTDLEKDALKAAAQSALRGDFERVVGKDLLDRFMAAVKEAQEKAKADESEEESPRQP